MALTKYRREKVRTDADSAWFLAPQTLRRLPSRALAGIRKITLGAATVVLIFTLLLGSFLGGEFMPKLEEGNLWIRAVLPQDASYEVGAQIAHEIREAAWASQWSLKWFRRWAARMTAPT